MGETSGSSLSTSGSDTLRVIWGGGCCYLLGEFDLEATCHSSLDSHNVLLHKVKLVEDPLCC